MGRGKTDFSCWWRMSLFLSEGRRGIVESVLWFYVSHNCKKRCSHLTSCDIEIKLNIINCFSYKITGIDPFLSRLLFLGPRLEAK